ncbi:hypothetical protein LOK49_LG05G02036 [Camellia lanceoleosa]|uniref:Uncharacterized protein n=1 Tax=Camellia lanceoleosa TaxID=1840588 RepID=A0ACC0HRI3_9ERIC|nr:hypothetical protein LOK49_LG05G02036 [Camellia lanceoleosa]
MPALSSTMTECKIVSWVKAEGDKLSKGESDMDVDTFYDGFLAAIIVDEAAVASAIALLAETQSEIAQAKSKATTSSPSPPPSPVSDSPPAVEIAAASKAPAAEGGKRIVASPYANVELGGVEGSGPMGRICR